MIILCPANQPCVDDQASLGNFSAEDPDILLFHGVRYKNQFPDPNPNPFYACLGLCVSQISQADADLCAENNAQVCELNPPTPYFPPIAPVNPINPPGHPIPPPPGPTPARPSTRFANQEQTCLGDCQDGGTETSIPAGRYFGSNQAEADAIAASYCEQHLVDMGCLTNFLGGFCMDESIGTHFITTDNFFTSVSLTWTLAGSLPPGLSMNEQPTELVITGTPTTSGTFTFQIQARQGNDFWWRNYTFLVMEITTAAILPDAEVDAGYSTTLTTVGDLPPVSWTVKVGSTLPDGLFLEESTGEIHGTPTTPGDYIFTIEAQDLAT